MAKDNHLFINNAVFWIFHTGASWRDLSLTGVNGAMPTDFFYVGVTKASGKIFAIWDD